MGRGQGALAAVTPSRMIRIWGERTYEGKVFALGTGGLRDSTVYYCTSPSFALTVSKYHELSLAWRCSPTLALIR
jgi:hypothetical protein